MNHDTDTDTPRPTLTLFDCTGSPGTEFILADTDEGPPAERLPFLYVTHPLGKAMDLPATYERILESTDIQIDYTVTAAANLWTLDQIEDVLDYLPLNSRVGVNLEYWDGKDGWTLDQFVCSLARFKAMRPDLRLYLYAAHQHNHPKEYAAVLPFVDGIIDSLYVGVYSGIWRIRDLMKTNPEAIVMTGWVKQMKEGRPIEPTEAEVRDIMRQLFEEGVTNMGIWMGPNKPGVHLRLPDRIIPMARWAQEEFAKVHGPVTDPPAGTSDGDSDGC